MAAKKKSQEEKLPEEKSAKKEKTAVKESKIVPEETKYGIENKKDVPETAKEKTVINGDLLVNGNIYSAKDVISYSDEVKNEPSPTEKKYSLIELKILKDFAEERNAKFNYSGASPDIRYKYSNILTLINKELFFN